MGVFHDKEDRAMAGQVECKKMDQKVIDDMLKNMNKQNKTEGYIGIQYGTEIFKNYGPEKHYEKYGKIGMKVVN